MFKKFFGSKKPSASPEFQKVLASEDLDDLLKAAMKIQKLSESDLEISKSIIEDWKQPQPLYNLLIHNRFIPTDLRINSLIKGLSETQNLPFVMAATVGAQQCGIEQLSDDEKLKIKGLLMDVLESDLTPLAMRATTSIREYLSEDDIPKLASYVHHKDDSVAKNIVSAIAKLIGKDQVLNYINEHNDLNQKDKEKIIAIITDHQKKAEKNEMLKHFGIDMPLLGYIPNLKEFV